MRSRTAHYVTHLRITCATEQAAASYAQSLRYRFKCEITHTNNVVSVQNAPSALVDWVV